MMDFDAKQLQLLMKAKLLGKGFIFIKSIQDTRKLFKQSDGGVLMQTDRLRIDYTQLTDNSTHPALGPGEIVSGCWTIGMSKDDVETIKSLGVPVIGKYQNLPYRDGSTFDLTNPAETALFNVLSKSGAVALDEDSVGDKRFFFVKSMSKKKATNKKKVTMRAALNLAAELIGTHKRMICEIMNQKLYLDYNVDELVDDDVNDLIDDWVLDLVTAEMFVGIAEGDFNRIQAEAALCKGLNKHIFTIDVSNRILRSINGETASVYAENYDEALMFLVRDSKEVAKINLMTSTSKVIITEKAKAKAKGGFDDMYLSIDDVDYSKYDFFTLEELDAEGLISYMFDHETSKDYSGYTEVDKLLAFARRLYLTQFNRAELVAIFQEYIIHIEGTEYKVPKVSVNLNTMRKETYNFLLYVCKQIEQIEQIKEDK